MARNPSPKMIEPEPKAEDDQMSESYISVGLGILVVVVVGILLYNFFTQKNTSQNTANEESTTEETTNSAQNANTYVVKEGDTLWTIAETVYKSGYNWVDLAKANNLTGNEELKVGQQLVVPSPMASPLTESASTSEPTPAALSAASPASQVQQSVTPVETPKPMAPTTVTGNSYTVVKGDTLWDIACRAYGDCYAWSKISQANKLANPNLIYTGNILTLPR